MSFASETTVPAEKSRAEIEQVLRRYGADRFFSGWQEDAAYLGFRAHDRYIKFLLKLPSKEDKEIATVMRRGSRYRRTPEQVEQVWRQEERRRWRALLLVIKAKLEAVESKISTFENEFLANIVLPDDRLLGEAIRTWLAEAYATGKFAALPATGEARDE